MRAAEGKRPAARMHPRPTGSAALNESLPSPSSAPRDPTTRGVFISKPNPVPPAKPTHSRGQVPHPRYTTAMSRRRSVTATPTLAATPSAAIETHPWRDPILTGLMLGVILLAFIRCVVPVTPNLYWEDDPRRVLADAGDGKTDRGSNTSEEISPQFFGIAEVAALDAVSITVAALALLAHAAFGGALRWPSIIIALVGMVFCFIHARSHSENAFHCGAWLGGIALALAAVHLASRPRQRRWVIAALVALAVPLAVDAARYVSVDHAESVAFFKENEKQWLEARGWEAGSPQHLMYVRRMEFGEPTGAFTFSNILGSVVAAIAVLAGTLAIGLWRQRTRLGRRWVLPAIVALVAVWTTLLTRSKGAPIAAIMAAGVVVAGALWRTRPWLPRALPALGIGLVITAIALVIVRGMAGPPPNEHGERSILFRWHYWQAAARIITGSPRAAIMGAGPAEFADDYNWAKNPLNPEEIRSAHNVFIDLIAMLGIGGIALSALLLAWLIVAARNAATDLCAADVDEAEAITAPIAKQAATLDSPSRDAKPPKKSGGAFEVASRDIAWTVAFLVLLFGCEMAVRGSSYATPMRFMTWSIGMMGAFFLLSVLVSPRWLPRGFDRLGLFAAAAVLLVHAQIEMTFFQASSAPLAWMILGAAAAERARDDGAPSRAAVNERRLASRVWPMMPAGLLLIMAIAYISLIAAPVARQEATLREAARTLRVNTGPAILDAMRQLNDAMHAPANPKAYEWHARLSMEVATGIKDSLRAVPAEQVAPRARSIIASYVNGALETFERAFAAGLDTTALRRQQAQFLAHAADVLADPTYLEKSLATWRVVVARRPYAWQDRVELADLLWKLERQNEARASYRAALDLSDVMYLEPTRMMAAIERKRIESRL